VWFGGDDVRARPGESTTLPLSIENAGEHTETFTIIPAGLAASWTTVTRSTITLFGGSIDVVEVVIRPPAIHTTSSGPNAVALRVITQSNPDETTIAETVVFIEPFDDRRIVMLQPLQRARRRASYEFMLENHGNSLANCRLHLVDVANRVDGTFDPPAVGVAPGGRSLVRLRLRTKGRPFRGREQQLSFEIEATEPEHARAIARATLIQPATIPARLLARWLAGLALIAAIIAAWFGVVRPELRDAAERAVDERIAEIDSTAPVTTIVNAPATTVADPADEAGAPDDNANPGVVDSHRIAVDVAIGQERSESVLVPPDSHFLLTDVVLQNPNNDLGVARLLQNDEVLYTWNLGEMTSANEFQPRVSALPFGPGDSIVFSVACAAAGDVAATGCDVSVLLTGQLVPVET
jgi:hypothetical protein